MRVVTLEFSLLKLPAHPLSPCLFPSSSLDSQGVTEETEEGGGCMTPI